MQKKVDKKLKKIDIINSLTNKTGYSHTFSKKLINDLIEIIIQNIKTGNFNLKNVGSFIIKYKNERIGRNPKTGEEFIINSRKSLKFTISKNIKDKLNTIL